MRALWRAAQGGDPEAIAAFVRARAQAGRASPPHGVWRAEVLAVRGGRGWVHPGIPMAERLGMALAPMAEAAWTPRQRLALTLLGGEALNLPDVWAERDAPPWVLLGVLAADLDGLTHEPPRAVHGLVMVRCLPIAKLDPVSSEALAWADRWLAVTARRPALESYPIIDRRPPGG